jgi:hypothetical protein
MFWVAYENSIGVYTDSVTEFIRKGIDDVVPTRTIRTYSNLKPCIEGSIQTKHKEQTTAFSLGKMTGNMDV